MTFDPTQVIALLLRKTGKLVNGAYEIEIPNHLMISLTPTGTLESEANEKGVTLRYRQNLTIEGKFDETKIAKPETNV
jgi:hypothetical protein